MRQWGRFSIPTKRFAVVVGFSQLHKMKPIWSPSVKILFCPRRAIRCWYSRKMAARWFTATMKMRFLKIKTVAFLKYQKRLCKKVFSPYMEKPWKFHTTFRAFLFGNSCLETPCQTIGSLLTWYWEHFYGFVRCFFALNDKKLFVIAKIPIKAHKIPSSSLG